MKLYNPNNFIKDQVLPSQYKGEDIYVKDVNSETGYTKIQGTDLYIKDDNNYYLIGKLNGSYNAIWFASDMDFLNRKLDKAQKQLTMWDFYHITEVVNQVSEFEIKQNSLIALTGLIINCGTFIANEESYSTGDIVFRMADGSLQHIRAERGGMFYPSKLERINANNFKFSYSFINTPPSQGEKEISEENNVWDASGASTNKTITFEDVEISNPTTNYSIVQTVGAENIHFEGIYITNQLVQPIIKTFIQKQSGEYEEIYSDYSLEFDSVSGEFTLSFSYPSEKLVVIK